MKISKRHIAKSISWRILGSIDTLLFAWLITGDFNEGLSMSGITTVTKLVWYYFHEQFWLKSSVVDSNKRHIIKTFTWRIIGTVDTVLFGWMIGYLGYTVGQLITNCIEFPILKKMYDKSPIFSTGQIASLSISKAQILSAYCIVAILFAAITNKLSIAPYLL